MVLPGFEGAFKPDDAPGMHTTETSDYVFVHSGEVWLELDDGAEKLIRTGDFVVQDGTRHAWHKRSPGPVVLHVMMLGATRERA